MLWLRSPPERGHFRGCPAATGAVVMVMCMPKGTLCCSSPAALSGTLRFFLQLRQLRSTAGLHAGELPARLRARAEPLSTHPGPGCCCCCCWESRNQGGGDPSLLFAPVHPAGNPNSSGSIASGWFAADKLCCALNTGGREINALKKSANKSAIAPQTQASLPGSPGSQGAPPATLPPFQPLPAGRASSRETSSAPKPKMNFLLGCLNECKGAGQPHSSQAMAGAGGFRLGAGGEIRGSCVSPTSKDIRTSPAPWGLGNCASSASGDEKRAIFHPRNRN